MKSGFLVNFFLRARSLSSAKTHICSSAIALAVGLSANAGAAEDWQEMPIKIGRAEHYFSERCVNVDAQQQVQYRFESPHPLDFNIHYHTDSTTELKAEETQIASFSSQFTSDREQEFCFMWTNKKKRDADWGFVLSYKISPLP